MAATYPPGPEPIITTSNFSISKIERQLLRVLDAFLHFNQKRDRFFAVDRAMIVAEREIHHRPHFRLAVDRDRARHDFVHAKNSGLRRIENRRAQERSVDAAV